MFELFRVKIIFLDVFYISMNAKFEMALFFLWAHGTAVFVHLIKMDNTLMFQLWLIAEATEQLHVIIKTSQWAWQLKHQ